MNRRVAAIDIGTVTTRLLVVDVDDGRIAEVKRRTEITQLGEGWTATGRLSREAIERVSARVGAFAAEARELGAQRTGAVATSAAPVSLIVGGLVVDRIGPTWAISAAAPLAILVAALSLRLNFDAPCSTPLHAGKANS